MDFKVGDIIQENEYLHNGQINKNRPTLLVLDFTEFGNMIVDKECTGVCYVKFTDVIFTNNFKNYTKVF